MSRCANVCAGPSRLSLVLGLILLFYGFGLAQTTGGTISGLVEDGTGARIPGATVEIKNLDTGVTRTLTTDEQGRYTAPNLSLGRYEVTASTSGFQTAVRSGITLSVGREAVVNLTLEVGAVTERVQVTGEAPLVNTTRTLFEEGGINTLIRQPLCCLLWVSTETSGETP